MWETIQTNADTIISTTMILLPLLYAVRGRIISDTNMLETFKTAKASIVDSNNIKFDVQGTITRINKTIEAQREVYIQQQESFQNAILEFQQDELYTKMLLGLSELDELHKTIQNKDATIELLGSQIKETNLVLQEIKNQLKG